MKEFNFWMDVYQAVKQKSIHESKLKVNIAYDSEIWETNLWFPELNSFAGFKCSRKKTVNGFIYSVAINVSGEYILCFLHYTGLNDKTEYAMDKNSFVQLVLVSQVTKATLKDMEMLDHIAKLESRNKELEQQVLTLKSRIKKAIGALQ